MANTIHICAVYNKHGYAVTNLINTQLKLAVTGGKLLADLAGSSHIVPQFSTISRSLQQSLRSSLSTGVCSAVAFDDFVDLSLALAKNAAQTRLISSSVAAANFLCLRTASVMIVVHRDGSRELHNLPTDLAGHMSRLFVRALSWPCIGSKHLPHG